jgi:phosphate uptake regulator
MKIILQQFYITMIKSLEKITDKAQNQDGLKIYS